MGCHTIMLLNIMKQFTRGIVKINFGFIKNACKVLNILKPKYFITHSASTYDFSNLYTTLSYNQI